MTLLVGSPLHTAVEILGVGLVTYFVVLTLLYIMVTFFSLGSILE